MKLEVWQKSIELYKLVWKTVYVDIKLDYKLRAQIADAAQSVSSNIAEGYSRRSINEYIQFLYIALSSLAETLTRTIGLKVTEQISEARFQEIDVLHYEIENKLLRLVESLEAKRDDGSWTNRIAEVQDGSAEESSSAQRVTIPAKSSSRTSLKPYSNALASQNSKTPALPNSITPILRNSNNPNPNKLKDLRI